MDDSLKTQKSENYEVNPDEFITWHIVYSALRSFNDLDEVDQPAVDLSADISSESTSPFICHDLVVLQMKEEFNEEELEGDPINVKDCNLHPTIKPQPMKAMGAPPSSDTKLLKQQLNPPPYMTEDETLLSSKPNTF